MSYEARKARRYEFASPRTPKTHVARFGDPGRKRYDMIALSL